MNINRLETIFNTWTDKKLSSYSELLLNKLQRYEKKMNFLTILILLLVCIYYLIELSVIDSINILFISINDLTKIKVFIPLVMSFTIFRYIVISFQHSIHKNFTSHYFLKYFKMPQEDNGSVHLNDFCLSIFPTSIFEQIWSIEKKSKIGIISKIIIIVFILLPIIIINTSPIIFLLTWIIDLISNFESLNNISKLSTIISIWLLCLAIYYLIKIGIINNKKAKPPPHLIK